MLGGADSAFGSVKVSEAEYLSLMNEYINSVFFLVSVLFSLLFSFLLVCYFAARKLDFIVSGILLAIYSAAYFFIGGATINGNRQISSFANKMRATEFDFSWAQFMELDTEIVIGNGLVIMSYIASLCFFFYMRFISQKRGTRS
jgi:ABC-type uncharacterized transport system permease subunit